MEIYVRNKEPENPLCQEGPFDYILSNPPVQSEPTRAQPPTSHPVRQHDPMFDQSHNKKVFLLCSDGFS